MIKRGNNRSYVLCVLTKKCIFALYYIYEYAEKNYTFSSPCRGGVYVC